MQNFHVNYGMATTQKHQLTSAPGLHGHVLNRLELRVCVQVVARLHNMRLQHNTLACDDHTTQMNRGV